MQPWGYPLTKVARRFLARAAYRLVRQPATVLLTVGLVAFWVVGGPSAIPMSGAGLDAADQAAEQYMRAWRDRDSIQLLSVLSPEMRGVLERQSGVAGPAAAARLFSERDRRGELIVDYRLIGRHMTVQGDTLYFYVVRAERVGERRDIPYALTVSAEGRVIGVE